jgi:hypothetical protein
MRLKERAMGWYYHLESSLSFPFTAHGVAGPTPLGGSAATHLDRAPLRRRRSPLDLGQQVG